MVGGQALEGDGGGVVEVQAFGEWDQVSCWGDGVLSVSAGPEQGDHAVARGDIVDPLPHLGDDARHLGAWDKGKVLGFDVLVAATHGVCVVDAGGADLDQGLTLTRLGTPYIDVP